MRGDNLREKLAHIAEHWSPKTVATVNDYDVCLAKVHGEFVRHPYPESATLAEPTTEARAATLAEPTTVAKSATLAEPTGAGQTDPPPTGDPVTRQEAGQAQS